MAQKTSKNKSIADPKGEPVKIRHLSVVPDPTPVAAIHIDRNAAIAAIRSALRRRSGKAWSVRGGTGTAWGWITVSAPPRRLVDHVMTAADAAELADLLGLDRAHGQGVSIADSAAHRREYIARAEGREPEVIGTPYWD